ncbi:hypothetical protein [Arthrobacter sp. Br18]|nr:hypothetical protein [Arthrobacter sp. Br18]
MNIQTAVGAVAVTAAEPGHQMSGRTASAVALSGGLVYVLTRQIRKRRLN